MRLLKYDIEHRLSYASVHFLPPAAPQGEKRAEEADGSKENREDQPGEDQRETSG